MESLGSLVPYRPRYHCISSCVARWKNEEIILIHMKIGIIGSMHFSEKMIEVANELKNIGHEPILSNFVHTFIGKNNTEKEAIKIEQKITENAMKRDWESMKEADALLVINLERHGIENYIGGNTLFELAAGYFSNKKIYL